MKSLITAFITTIFIISAQAQTVTHRLNDNPSTLYTNPSRFSKPIDTVPANEWISVIELTANDFHKINYNGNIGYILKKDVAYSMHEYTIDSIKYNIELDKAQKKVDKQRSKLDSISFYYDKFVNSLCKNCLYITNDYNTDYNYTDFTFNINSRYNKPIKYVTIYAQPYNPVDDKIGSPLKFKAVGPITNDDIATYTFENRLYSHVFSYAKITKVLVQFMDLTQITLKGTDINYSQQSINYLKKSLEYTNN